MKKCYTDISKPGYVLNSMICQSYLHHACRVLSFEYYSILIINIRICYLVTNDLLKLMSQSSDIPALSLAMIILQC